MKARSKGRALDDRRSRRADERRELADFGQRGVRDVDQVAIGNPEAFQDEEAGRILLAPAQLEALNYPRLERIPETWRPYLPHAA